jgi:hypothetical protein
MCQWVAEEVVVEVEEVSCYLSDGSRYAHCVCLFVRLLLTLVLLASILCNSSGGGGGGGEAAAAAAVEEVVEEEAPPATVSLCLPLFFLSFRISQLSSNFHFVAPLAFNSLTGYVRRWRRRRLLDCMIIKEIEIKQVTSKHIIVLSSTFL